MDLSAPEFQTKYLDGSQGEALDLLKEAMSIRGLFRTKDKRSHHVTSGFGNDDEYALVKRFSHVLDFTQNILLATAICSSSGTNSFIEEGFVEVVQYIVTECDTNFLVKSTPLLLES